MIFSSRVYARAIELPRPDPHIFTSRTDLETPFFGEPDRRHHSIVGSSFSAARHDPGLHRHDALRDRISFVNELRREGRSPGVPASISLLLPEWLKRRIRDKR